MLIAEFDSSEGVSGIRYNPKTEVLVAWVSSKSTHKPKLVDLVKEKQGAMILKTMKDTSPLEVATMTMHSAMFTRDAVKHMKEKSAKLEGGHKDMNDEIKRYEKKIKNMRVAQEEIL